MLLSLMQRYLFNTRKRVDLQFELAWKLLVPLTYNLESRWVINTGNFLQNILKVLFGKNRNGESFSHFYLLGFIYKIIFVY